MKKKNDYFEMTKEDFLALKNRIPTKKDKINGIIIVPTDEIHDSGYNCMKFILTYHDKIVGVVSGWSDVIHINGIGGYGNWCTSKPIDFSKKPVGYGWRIDCLPKSKCVRLFSEELLQIDDFIGSDFQFYVKE